MCPIWEIVCYNLWLHVSLAAGGEAFDYARVFYWMTLLGILEIQSANGGSPIIKLKSSQKSLRLDLQDLKLANKIIQIQIRQRMSTCFKMMEFYAFCGPNIFVFWKIWHLPQPRHYRPLSISDQSPKVSSKNHFLYGNLTAKMRFLICDRGLQWHGYGISMSNL